MFRTRFETNLFTIVLKTVLSANGSCHMRARILVCACMHERARSCSLARMHACVCCREGLLPVVLGGRDADHPTSNCAPTEHRMGNSALPATSPSHTSLPSSGLSSSALAFDPSGGCGHGSCHATAEHIFTPGPSRSWTSRLAGWTKTTTGTKWTWGQTGVEFLWRNDSRSVVVEGYVLRMPHELVEDDQPWLFVPRGCR